jgi:hypothetical protein
MGMTAAFAMIDQESLNSFKKDATGVADFFYENIGSAEIGLDIDKSWAAIHFMLTGTQWGGEIPQALPVLGGTAIGDDAGYGPLRYLDTEEVKAAHTFLSSLPPSELRKRFIPVKLEAAEIYPTGIWEAEGEAGFEYVEHFYEALRSFYARASAENRAVLLGIV